MRAAAISVVVLLSLPDYGASNAGAGTVPIKVPFEFSQDDEIGNQEAAITYFEKKYYNNENLWSLNDDSLTEANALAQATTQVPALALAAAQVLYLFAWYKRSGEIIRENIALAAQLFEQSILIGGCSADMPVEVWLGRACDIRVGQAMLLDSWLADTDSDASRGAGYRERAYGILGFLKTTKRFENVAKSWTHPLQMNFNQLRYNNPVSKPIWDSSTVPLAVFLDQHHHIFKAELEAILSAPGDLYEELRKADGSIESLATPGGWDAIRIVRYGHWFEGFCSVAPQTCALLRTRPEIAQCPYVNTNYYKLWPGAHLKPHFGNAPRMTASMAVIAPEPLRSGISVGDKMAVWFEGRTLIIDDTYPHSVSHWGTEPRYVLATWFCHPCDENNDNGGAECPEWVKRRS
eukprot:TRINITY_DN12475_c0_g1_i1.p1 TRINITY_DN12475_c0_g1~~TRINITY_DN12475_c0_g1_i1.p1  ORF type:complete len:406 (+),score=54.91 TRINITY_DN12475_c0_g1_i1:115-1332(+)